MSADLPPRPRQLVLAAGVVIGGSAFLLAAVFDSLGSLESVDTRERLNSAITSSAGKDLGVTLDQALQAMRAALGLTAVCAAIALVLGIYVLQRHRGARIALSVVAVPLLVTAPLVGGFLGALVAIATLMLWNGPAGDWYAGRPIRETTRPSRPSEPPNRSEGTLPPLPPAGAPPVAPSDAPSTRETSSAPGATQGFGVPAATGVVTPTAPAAQQPWPQQPAGPPVAAVTPAPVRLACVLTWMFSGSVALVYLAGVVALLVDKGTIVDRVVDTPAWRDSGLQDDVLVPLLWFGVVLFLAWSVGACVLAFLTWRRVDWARYLLAVSAGLALLVGAIAFPVGLLHQLAAGATIAALFSPRARAWFATRTPPRQGPRQGPPPGPPSGPPPGPPSGPPPPPAPRQGPW